MPAPCMASYASHVSKIQMAIHETCENQLSNLVKLQRSNVKPGYKKRNRDITIF